MRVLSFLSVLGICAIMVSCTKGLNEEQNKKLSQLEHRVDSTLEIIQAIDTAKGLASANHFFENMDYIKLEMNDTLDKELIFFIDKYYALRKAFKLFGNEYPKVLEELTISKQQLENLRHDAEYDKLEEGQFEKYYHLESNNLILAEEAANDLIFAIGRAQPKYDEMNPRIDSLVQASKQKQAKVE